LLQNFCVDLYGLRQLARGHRTTGISHECGEFIRIRRRNGR
jgi:hypothetical protein